MVWLYRSPIPVGRREVFLLVQIISTCQNTAHRWRGEGVGILWYESWHTRHAIFAQCAYQYKLFLLLYSIYFFWNNAERLSFNLIILNCRSLHSHEIFQKQYPNSKTLTGGIKSPSAYRVVVLALQTTWDGWSVRQPYAAVDFIPQSGIYEFNSATEFKMAAKPRFGFIQCLSLR